MEKLNAYTVTIQPDSNYGICYGEYLYNKSYTNWKSSKAKDNRAIQESIALLETLPEEQEIGILIVRQEMIKSFSGNKYIGGNLYNIYSHIYNDKSNWVTVKEALDFLKNM